MMQLGCIPDAPDPNDRPFSSSPLLGAAVIVGADSIDHRPHLDAVQAQRGASCVGWSISSAVLLNAGLSGHAIARPSALLIYAMARLLAGGPPLIDAGSSFRFATKGMVRHGIVSNAAWPEVDGEINNVPPTDVFLSAEPAKVQGYYRIDDGPGSKAAIIAALKRGLCPVFAMVVDDKFGAIGREVYDSPGGAPWGWHAMTIVGYSVILDAFLVLNSWGTTFGDDGFVWIAADFFERTTFDASGNAIGPCDKWVHDVVPERLAA